MAEERQSVTAVLSAVDHGFTSAMGKASSAVDRLGATVKSGLGFGAFMAIGQSAVSAVGRGLGGLVREMSSSSAAWKTFTANMRMNNHTSKDIARTRKELQNFATKTIYNASDMASTFAQLDAVGTKNTTELVKGFGGLAAAAENPKQAMKTLSTQATQMAARPKVAWQDFKLMLDQTPAGISAVAKEMGMSSKELTAAVQDGKVSTEDFFDAVVKVGTSDAFTKLATSYKTVGEALDGMKETVSNTLQPAFDVLQDAGIDAVSTITDAIGKLDGKAIADKIKPAADAVKDITRAFREGGLSSAVDMLGQKLMGTSDGIKNLGAAFATAFAVTNGVTFLRSETWSGIKDNIAQTGKALKTLPSESLKKVSATMGKIIPSGLQGKIASMSSGVQNFGYTMNAVAKGSFGMWMQQGGKLQSAVGKVGGAIGKISPAFSAAANGALGAAQTMTNGLTSMMSLALKALAPAVIVGAALAGLGLLYQQFGGQIDQMIATATQKGPEIITGLASAIASRLPDLITSGTQMVTGLLGAVTANIPAVLQAGLSIIQALVSGVSANAGQLMTAVITTVSTLASGILGMLPQLVVTGMNLLLSLAQGIVENLPLMIHSAVSAVQNFISGLSDNLPTILSTAAQIVTTLVSGLVSNLPSIIQGAISIIASLGQGIISNLPMILQTGCQVLASLAVGVIQAIPQLVAAIPQVITSFVDKIMSTDWLAVGKQIISAIGQGIFGGLAGLGGKVGGFFGGIADWFAGGEKGGQNTADGAQAGMESESENLYKASTEMGSKTGDSFVDGLNSKRDAAQNTAKEFGTKLTEEASLAIESGTEKTKAAVDTLTQGANESMSSGLGELGTVTDSAMQDVSASVATGTQDAAQSAVQNAASIGHAFDQLSASASKADSAMRKLSKGASSMSKIASAASSAAKSLSTLGGMAQRAMSSCSGAFSAAAKSAVSAGQRMGQGVQAGVRTGLASVPSMAQSAMSRFTAAVLSFGNKAVAAARSASTKITTALRHGISPAGSAGRSIGAGFAIGITTGGASAVSRAHALSSRAASAMRSGYGSAYSAGRYIGSGLASGLAASAGSVAAQAARLAAAADAAIRAKAKIHSPSKVTEKSGTYIGSGLVVGMLGQVSSVFGAGKRLAVSAFRGMRAANQKGNYEKLAESYAKSFKSSFDAKASKQLEAAKDAVDAQMNNLKSSVNKQSDAYRKQASATKDKKAAAQYKALAKKYSAMASSYTKAGSAMKKAFTTAFNSATKKAVSAAEKSLTNLGKKYQEAYDAIIQKRKAFLSKLSDVGSLYSADSYGNVALKNFSAGTKQMKAYAANLKKLKKTLPDGLMEEILQLDTASGLAYTNKLLKMSRKELAAYGKTYSTYQRTAKQISNEYYQSQVDSLRKNYSGAVTKEMTALTNKLNQIGKDTMQGFISGMNSKKKTLDSTGKSLADTVMKAIKQKLKIHSPSKVMKDLGRYTGGGLAVGIRDTMREVQSAMNRLILIPELASGPELSIAGMGSGNRLQEDCEYYTHAHYTVTVPVHLDGKKVAEVTAPYTEAELDKRQKRASRKKGLR